MTSTPPSRRAIASLPDKDLAALAIVANVRAKQLQALASQVQSEASAWRHALQFARNECRTRAQKIKAQEQKA